MIKYLIKLLQQTAGWIQNKNSIAVNYVIIKTKQLKNIAILTFLSVGVGLYFDIKYACFFPIHNRYHQNLRGTKNT